MAMSKGTSHYNHKSWEDGTFPILCQTCLGDNPFMRVMKDRHGSECKVCTRPFTTFRWCPGARMRYKKTEICQTCSRAKNICQTCLLDLQYGLPVQVRDSVLGTELAVPKSEINREYFLQNLDKAIAGSDATEAYGKVGEVSAEANEILTKLARNNPYYRRNRAHICSFWVKGECRRGEECPYRHDTPTDPEDPLSKQNISDRYHGNNDPVAEKMLKRASEMPKPVAPEDKGITTLYIGSVGEEIDENDLKDYFYQFGEIRSINVVRKSGCAFVEFTNRPSAESAIEKSFQKLIIKDCKLAVRWGRSAGKRKNDDEREDDRGLKFQRMANIPGLPVGTPGGSREGVAGPSGSGTVPSLRAAPALSRGVYYPSQDPSRMGAHGLKQWKK